MSPSTADGIFFAIYVADTARGKGRVTDDGDNYEGMLAFPWHVFTRVLAPARGRSNFIKRIFF